MARKKFSSKFLFDEKKACFFYKFIFRDQLTVKKIVSVSVGKNAYHIVFIYENYMISLFADRKWNYLFGKILIVQFHIWKLSDKRFFEQK